MSTGTLEPTGTPQDYGFPEKPTAAQITTWTLQEKFLAEYSICGGIYKAAALAGHSYRGYMNWVEADKFMFQKRYEAAQAQYLEKMVLEVDRRAMEGFDKPIFQGGQQVGTQRVYSDNLLMFSVKQRDPSYRDAAIINVDASAIEELVRGLRGRQIEDSKALPPAHTIIEHKPSGDAPPWQEQ